MRRWKVASSMVPSARPASSRRRLSAASDGTKPFRGFRKSQSGLLTKAGTSRKFWARGQNVKPQDFFVSVRELFGILIPGIIFLSVLGDIDGGFTNQSYQYGFRIGVSKEPDASDIIIMLAAAYAIGTIINGLGSLLDGAYDLIGQRLKWRDRGPRFIEFERIATDAKIRAVANIMGIEKSRTFLWSNKSFWNDRIKQICPEGSVQLDKIEATQKFFRSMCIVFIFLSFVYMRDGAAAISFIVFLFLICFVLYAAYRSEWEYRMLKWVALCQLDEKRPTS
jgi:hypothetical protein